MIEPPSRNSGSAFCTVNSSPLTLMLKIRSKCSSVIEPRGANSPTPGVGEHDVDVPLLPLHRLVKPVEVRQIRHVALHAGDVLADLP